MLWIDDSLCKTKKDNNMLKICFADDILAENDVIVHKNISHA